MMPRLLALALTLFAAVPAAAQQRTAPFATAPAAPALSDDTVPDTVLVRRSMSRSERIAVRSASGGLGWVAGAFAGGAAGLALEGRGQDDSVVLTEMMFGAAIGGVVGGAAGAAIPRPRRGCGFGARFGKGLLGSLAGSVVGLALTSVESGASLLAVPVAGGIGAALAADC